jgi:Rieske Fe-S protein
VKDCDEIVDCSGRREFLIKAAFIAGGLVLTMSGAAAGISAAAEEVTVPIDDKSPLHRIGGSMMVDSPAGQIIVVRTGDTTYVAFSAVCTHKRGIVEYDEAKKQFECPKHHSRFDGSNGNVLDGPADDPLPSYQAKGTAASVTVTIGS